MALVLTRQFDKESFRCRERLGGRGGTGGGGGGGWYRLALSFSPGAVFVREQTVNGKIIQGKG